MRPVLDHPFFEAHPALADLSSYAMSVAGPPRGRPDHQHRGAFAVGNGAMFALMGLSDPLNTLHSAVGPVYDKRERFFGDVSIELEEDGEVAAFEREWIARVRSTAVNVTRADTRFSSVYTVDFAPHSRGSPPVIVRFILVRRSGDGTKDVSVRLSRSRRASTIDGRAVEVIESVPRYLAHIGWSGDTDRGRRFELGSLGPGQAAQAVLVLATGTSTSAIADIAASLPSEDPNLWLEDTLKWWKARMAGGLALAIDDERVRDLYDSMRVSILAQQSTAGAICPMSRYTGMWLRDTIGPVRFLLQAGLHEDARAALDYLHRCHAVRGDIGNACGSGLAPGAVVDEPDWASLEPFRGRTRAEGPSYLPLMYRAYAQYTGRAIASNPVA